LLADTVSDALSAVPAKGAKELPKAVGASLIEASDPVPPLESQG